MSDFLFANPSFVSGVARVADLGGAFDAYNTTDTPEDADRRALQQDWIVVGEDLRRAIEEGTKGMDK